MLSRVSVLIALVAMACIGCTSQTPGESVVGAFTLAPEIGSDATDMVGLRQEFEESPQEVNEYWSDSALTEATPRSPGDPGTPSDGPTDEPTGAVVPPSDGPIGTVAPDANGSVADGRPFPAAGISVATQGRLYYVFNGLNYVCSASVVNSATRNVVATAAHCMWDTEGQTGFASNVLFIPADSANGQGAPYGRWTAAAVFLSPTFQESAFIEPSTGYVTGDGWAFDFAFIVMAPNEAGQQIQDVTGGQGVAFGVPVEGLVVIGYPTAPPFDGNSERYCASPSWDESSYGGYGIPCVMTPGSSGGGWFTRFDPARGVGYLVSMTSTLDGSSLYGVSLGQEARGLYQAAGGF